MKVWFDTDCERILSMVKDMCPDCEELYCNENDNYINEVTLHKRDGCLVFYVEMERIGTTTLMMRDNGNIREATVDDLEKAYLDLGVPVNFAYALARIQPLKHTVIKN